MAINIKSAYPANADSPSLSYLTGSFRNDSAPEAEDGTPLEMAWANDFLGARDAILKRAGVTASGDVETAEESDVLNSLEIIIKDIAYGFDSKPIGEPFAIWSHISGVSVPSNAGGAKFIKLSASDVYNSGLLTGEVVSGSSPNIDATATISYAESPINGQSVVLINTTRHFLRPGASGVSQSSQNMAHIHDITGVTNVGGAEPSGVVGNTLLGDDGETKSSGGDESRPRNIGATYYMRIA